MRRLLKFVILPATTEIETADEPRFLHVDWQGHNLCVWVEATPGVGHTERVAAFRTGDPVPVPAADYIGSAQTLAFGPPMVMHVYREAKP